MSLASRRRQRGAVRRRGRGPGAIGRGIDIGRGILGGVPRRRPGARFARRRAKGITATELRGFRKVSGLLGRLGMVPRRLRGARPMKPRRRT